MPEPIFRQLDQAVAEVFALMFGRDCQPEASPPPACAPPCIGASVLFSGSLLGACALHLSPTAAAELTHTLTGAARDALPITLLADTAGELCNMIAGCWKSLQPPEIAACALSCPILSHGTCRPVPLFRETVLRLYQFAGHHFRLELSLDSPAT